MTSLLVPEVWDTKTDGRRIAPREIRKVPDRELLIPFPGMAVFAKRS